MRNFGELSYQAALKSRTMRQEAAEAALQELDSGINGIEAPHDNPVLSLKGIGEA